MTTLPRLPPSAALARAACGVLVTLAALILAGCRSLPLQPPIDLSRPGWIVREGQAIWRPRAGADGVAGDLVVAKHPDGRSVVQFTKTPLPFLVAQRTAEGWQAQFIPRNKTYSGRGEPPTRLLWLHLPEALARGRAGDGFRFTTNATGGWRFERRASGESLEGYLEPSSKIINHLPRTTGANLCLNADPARCARPPPPGPLPQGEGVLHAVWSRRPMTQVRRKTASDSPSPQGRGPG